MTDEVALSLWETGEKAVGSHYSFAPSHEKLVIVFYCENSVVACKGEPEGTVEKTKSFERYFDHGFVGRYFIVGAAVTGVCTLSAVHNTNSSIDNSETVIKTVKNTCYTNGGPCHAKVTGAESKEWNTI